MANAIADQLAKAPSCRRIVFEAGRMAPILFHGLSQLGLAVVCVESRQAYQALKSLATTRPIARRRSGRDGAAYYRPSFHARSTRECAQSVSFRPFQHDA